MMRNAAYWYRDDGTGTCRAEEWIDRRAEELLDDPDWLREYVAPADDAARVELLELLGSALRSDDPLRAQIACARWQAPDMPGDWADGDPAGEDWWRDECATRALAVPLAAALQRVPRTHTAAARELDRMVRAACEDAGGEFRERMTAGSGDEW